MALNAKTRVCWPCIFQMLFGAPDAGDLSFCSSSGEEEFRHMIESAIDAPSSLIFSTASLLCPKPKHGLRTNQLKLTQPSNMKIAIALYSVECRSAASCRVQCLDHGGFTPHWPLIAVYWRYRWELYGSWWICCTHVFDWTKRHVY